MIIKFESDASDVSKREAYESQHIDTGNNYYTFEFITKGIDWVQLNDE